MAHFEENLHSPGGVAMRANAICMLSMITWAAGFPAAEYLLATWDPLALITARLMMAVGFLIPVWILVDGPQALLRARWGRGTLVGGIGFGGGAYLLLLGQDLSDPVTVTVVAAGMPVIAAIVEVLFDGRRLRRNFVFGIALAVLGGLVVSGANVRDSAPGLGALMALISVICFTWGSRATVRDFPELSAVGQTTLTLAGAMIFTSVLLIATRLAGFGGAVSEPVDTIQWAMLAVYALGAMALSQLLWIMGVGRLGIAIAGMHLNVAPFYVMLMVVALGGVWSWLQGVGALLIALGVVLAQRPPRKVR